MQIKSNQTENKLAKSKLTKTKKYIIEYTDNAGKKKIVLKKDGKVRTWALRRDAEIFLALYYWSMKPTKISLINYLN